MIARVWEGKTRNEHSGTYTQIIEERDIPEYRNTPGFIKLSFLKYSDKEFTYFKLLTFWTDLQTIKYFTGPNFKKVVSYKQDEQYLLDFPGNVTHYEVFGE